ncbi:MAG: GSCFA domain-containing protein [Bacteroidales bacterium]
MDLRTTFEIPHYEPGITYNDPVMFIGSCFSANIGKQFGKGHMPVMINPAGTVYNPVSVSNTIDLISGPGKFRVDDLYNFNGLWISFSHYTDFSSPDPDKVIEKINFRSAEASEFLEKAAYLFITFGTARVYRWKKTGQIVSNCHKIPQAEFTHELLDPTDITDTWNDLLDRLKRKYPGLKVIFTISPVRHWKDGAHGNQVSKSVLFLAVEKLLEHPSRPGYFPAYELMMDDLRDYRFYDNDMLHPSASATEYIWEAFSRSFFSSDTIELWREVSSVTKAFNHMIRNASGNEMQKFAAGSLKRIEALKARYPFLDLETERRYFLDLLKQGY